MSDPFFIEGPALISFSGGRTSAYMLWRILQAHGGTLPDGVHVAFANTGKEREETLRFVYECATAWGVSVRWLEWRDRPKGRPSIFEEVDFHSAARCGEPFRALIERKQYLPNSQMRYCTIELKIRVMRDFMKALGHKNWTNATGLRADEVHRVWKTYERNDSGKERFTTVCPLATAGITVRDVADFWKQQPFDLNLMSHEGNCDLCFLKGRGKRAEIIRARPDLAQWWIEAEAGAKTAMPSGARFHRDESVEMLVAAVSASAMFDFHEGSDPDDEHDAECGLWCAAA